MKPLFHKYFRLNIWLILLFIATAGGVIQAAPIPESVKIVNKGIAREKRSLCAMRDSYGFIWVGTLNGLCCYDGNGLQIYSPASSVVPMSEGISVNALQELNGNIWFGGNQGLYIFNRTDNRIHRFDLKTEYGVIISSPVQKIAADNKGHLWILTLGQGIFIYDPVSDSLRQNSRHGAFYSDIAVMPDGSVYAITHDGHLLAFSTDGEVSRKLRLPDYSTDKNPIAMTVDGGKIHICANHTLYGYLPGDSNAIKELNFSTPSVVNTLIARPDHNLWLGSDEGIFCLNPNSSQLSPTPVSLSSTKVSESSHPLSHDSRVVQLTDDPAGGMIVVTNTGLLFITDRVSAVNPVPTPGRDGFNSMVNALCHDASGRRVWLGTDHGVSAYDINSASISPGSLPIGSDIVVTSLAESNGKLWIGSSHHGLFCYDENSGNVRKYTYDETIPYAVLSNCINDIYSASTGETFILTNWGLCRYNPESDNFISLTEIGIPFTTMQEDSRGRIWAFSANNAIYRRDRPNSRFDLIKTKALDGATLSLLHLDTKGGLWAVVGGTRLMRYDEDADDFVNRPIPLVTGHPIKFIEDDGNGSLWIATDERIVRYNPDSASNDRNFISDCRGANIGAVVSLPDRSMLFGTTDGLYSFSPTMASSRPEIPEVFFLSLNFPYLDDSDAELKRLGLDKLLYTLDEISLPYADNSFTVNFAATAASDIPEVRYQYRIDGTDKAWIPALGNKATFTDLSPGSYPLLLRPESGDEKDVKRLTIHILPPWYLSWQAWIVYFICIILIVWGAVRYMKLRMKRKTEEKIRTMQIEKERETYESKMRFFVNLVHEIRTPLTLINLPLEHLAEATATHNLSEAEKMKLIKAMRRNLDYLLGIINQLLDFRKADQDSEVRLALKDTDLTSQIDLICHRFAEPMASQQKSLSVNLPDKPIIVDVDQSKLDRVVMNILGNALKYCRSKVEVTLREDSDGISLMIADDGPGIPEEEREHIFDTYYQIAGDRVGADLGTGLGLAYARLIARAHGGDITVCSSSDSSSESETPSGACFRLTLPYPKNTTSKDDESQSQSDSTAEASPADKVGVNILFVEDNDELRAGVAEALSGQDRVITAANAEEAVEILNGNNDIDLIVSDFMMPGMDGAEFCRKVKGDIATSYIPFIMLTAKTGREAKEEAMEAGADAFVEKPFSMKQLRAQIANILHTRQLFHARMKSAMPIAEVVKEEEVPLINKMDAEFLRDLNQSIEENIFDDEFSIDSMADRMNISRSTFYRRIKAITGLTPLDYLKNYRLDHAARLLSEGMRSSEVASAVGFSSSSYFAKCFKAKFGLLPKEYTSKQK